MSMWHSAWGLILDEPHDGRLLGARRLVIVTLVRQGDGGGRRTSDAQALLDERLARDEVDGHDYRRRRDLIPH